MNRIFRLVLSRVLLQYCYVGYVCFYSADVRTVVIIDDRLSLTIFLLSADFLNFCGIIHRHDDY